MHLFFRLRNYLYFFFKSGNSHSIHSPFVFALYNAVIKSKHPYYCFPKIETIRKNLLKNKRRITVKDLGTGSHFFKSNQRTIAAITHVCGKEPSIAAILFKLAIFLKPTTIFELGTSVGITTTYLASSHSQTSVFTFEGCPETAQIAKENFQLLHLKNIRLVEGNIDETLPEVLKTIPEVSMVLFDANHNYQATLRYFNLLHPKATENTVFIFDDIYWDKEMNKAWKTISSLDFVTISIDFYHFGLIFFRKNAPKQHFILKT